MPIVVMKEGVNESSLKRSKQHDLPTPLSPMRRSLIYKQTARSKSCVSYKNSLPNPLGRRCVRRDWEWASCEAYQKVVIPCPGHSYYPFPLRSGPNWKALELGGLLFARVRIVCPFPKFAEAAKS